MSKKFTNFEDIFKETFKGFRVNPSPGLWSNIRYRLLLRQFFKFNWSSLNVYYVGLFLAGSVATYSVINNNKTEEIILENLATGVKEEIPSNNELVDAGIEKLKNSKEINITNDVNESGSDLHENNNKPLKLKNKNTVENEINNITNIQIVENTENNILSAKPVEDENAVELPIAAFIPSTFNGCENEEIIFTNNSTQSIWYKWDFGDGKVSFVKNPIHFYSEPGTYEVCLKIKGEDNEYYSTCKTILINDKPLARFEVDEFNSNFDNRSVYFNNLSINNLYNKWDFGDDQQSLEENPIHMYDKSGEYFVKLIVKNENNCIDSTIFKISFLKAKYFVEFPNAFTPSVSGPQRGYYMQGDNIDEIFYPKYRGVTDYKLYIYNRSGLVLFESSDINFGWNGYYKGSIVSHGVYIYECFGKFVNGESFHKKGTLTVIHKN
ncbi:MAG: PKD domain-containing protein [Bacteroidales bacterium]|nr:PKD domain-containing protein [Bacteroidales bacterium]